MPTPASAKRESFRRSQDFKHNDSGRGWICTVCPTTRRGPPFFPSFKAALNHERTFHGHARPPVKHDMAVHEIPRSHIPENHLEPIEDIRSDKIEHVPLTSEGLRQWEMHAHVDHVFDLVPFWQRGIDAAERGEVLRMEEFLEKMEGDGGWRTANDVLGMLGGWKVTPSERARDFGGPAWVQPYQEACATGPRWEPKAFDPSRSQRGWGAVSGHVASDVTESSRGRVSELGSKEGATSDFNLDRVDYRHHTNDAWDTQPEIQLRPTRRGFGNREDVDHFVDIIARQEAVDEERRRQMHMFFEMPTEQKINKIQETIRILRAHMATR